MRKKESAKRDPLPPPSPLETVREAFQAADKKFQSSLDRLVDLTRNTPHVQS